MFSVELQCRECGWRTVCGEVEVARRLRRLGLLRRAPDPPAVLVAELLKAHGARLVCDRCQQTDLAIAEEAVGRQAEDWLEAIVCEVCRRPIADERLAVFPQARRCVACQDAEDRGATVAEPEFCPRCGSLVELRVSRGGGITRYRRFCTGPSACRL